MSITQKNVTFQATDDLNESNLRRLIRIFTDGSGDGFVHRGLGISADYVNNNVDVGDGAALIVDDTGDGAYSADHPGVTDASIDPTTVNYLFLTIDPTVNNDVTIDIETVDTPPRTPALKIGEVDAASGTDPVEVNRGRSGDFESVITDTLTANTISGVSSLDTQDLTTTGTATVSNLDANGGSATLNSVDTTTFTVKSTPAQLALDGYVVPVGSGIGVSDAIDPTTTSTPLQDAHDFVGGNGAILLPPTKIQQSSTFAWTNNNLRIYGWGWPSRIEFTDLANPGVDYRGAIRTYVDGVVFDGSDPVNRTAPVWTHTVSNTQAQNFGQVWFQNGNDPVIDLNTNNPFSSHWEYVSFQGGSHEGQLVNGKFGVGCSIGNIYLAGGANVTGMEIGGNVVIDTMNVGGQIGPAVDHRGGATSDHFAVEKINYEPNNTDLNPIAVVRLGSDPSAYVGHIHITTGVPKYGVELYDSGTGPARNKVVGYIQPPNNLGISPVHIADPLPVNQTNGSLFYGPSSDVTDSTGLTRNTLRCLQDNATMG